MKNWMLLGVFWPVLLFALPSVYDHPVPDLWTYVAESDTTYADGRYAALIPGVTDTLIQGGTDTLIRFVPDPDSMGNADAYIAIREPSGSDFLVLSYDYLAVDALDSATVDSIWSDWGLGTPYAYVVDVPGSPSSPGTGVGDTSNAISYLFADFYGSNADLMNDVGDWYYSASWDPDSSKTELVDSTAYGDLSKAIQYNYVYDTDYCGDSVGVQSGCEAITRGTTIHNDVSNKPTITTSYREMWWEVSFRFSDNAFPCSYDSAWGAANLPATTDVPFDTVGWINYDPPCAHKFIEFNHNGLWGRQMWISLGSSATPNSNDTHELHWGLGGDDACATPGSRGLQFVDTLTQPPINNIADELPCDPGLRVSGLTYRMYDGKWHRARAYQKVSSDTLTYDGVYMLWVDDSLWVSSYRDSFYLRTNTDGDHVRMRIGANKDHGGVDIHTEHLWWSHAIVWADTPSWFSP